MAECPEKFFERYPGLRFNQTVIKDYEAFYNRDDYYCSREQAEYVFMRDYRKKQRFIFLESEIKTVFRKFKVVLDSCIDYVRYFINRSICDRFVSIISHWDLLPLEICEYVLELSYKSSPDELLMDRMKNLQELLELKSGRLVSINYEFYDKKGFRISYTLSCGHSGFMGSRFDFIIESIDKIVADIRFHENSVCEHCKLFYTRV